MSTRSAVSEKLEKKYGFNFQRGTHMPRGRGTVPLPQAVSIVEGEPLPFHDRQPNCERLTPGTCVSLPQGGQASPTLFDYGSTIWKPWKNLKEETWNAVWLAECGWLRRLPGCMFSWLGECLTGWMADDWMVGCLLWLLACIGQMAMPFPSLLKLSYRRPS